MSGHARRGHRRRRMPVWLVLAVAVLGPVAACVALWTGSGDLLRGAGVAGAAGVSGGAVPIASTAAGTATVTWGASTLSDGTAVSGYVVKRYDASSLVEQTITSGCSSIVTGLTCTESAVPTGTWRYTVTPAFADHWRGAESDQSGAVSIGAATLVLAQTLFGGPLPTNTTGSVAGFAANEAITYTLSGSPITGSPSDVGAGGAATITALSIAATGDGPHTVRVTGAASGLVASAGITIDTTPPVMTTVVAPEPNAHGWNRGPAEVNGSASDGTGSGVAFIKGTGDGSDPLTSPTAQEWTGEAVVIPVTTTIRYYTVDLAGNASAVQTLEVKIDEAPPAFAVDATDVTGGAYVTAGSPAGPGVMYYRGEAAGSFRLRATMIDDGGSSAASLGTSALTSVATGFTHTPAVITTPAGGPYETSLFSWVAGTTSTPTATLTVTDVAGNTTVAPGSVYNDSTAPAGGSADAAGLVGTGGRYSDSPTLHLALSRGSDGQSGLAAGGTQLWRASATLGGGDAAVGACGVYGNYTQIGADDPPAALTDTVPDDHTCYRYQYRVPDHVGNVAAYTSPDIKVHVVAASSLRPTDAVLAPVAGAGFQLVAASTVFYNPAQAGSFSVGTDSSSPAAGVLGVDFPAIAGFSGDGTVTTPVSGSTFLTTYAWSANAASPSPGTQAIMATDNTLQTATNANAFSVRKDGAAPSGGSVDATGLGGTGGRYSTSMTLSLAFDAGIDSLSGLAPDGRRLSRASAALASNGTSNGVCGAFGGYTQVGALDPVAPASDTVPTDRMCYRYHYVVSDNVGNQATYTSADVKVQAAAPPAPALSFTNLTNASSTGNAVFYRASAASGGFTVTATSADTTSGTTGFGFPTLPSGWTGSSGGTGVQSYSWSAINPTAPSGAQTVTTGNNAGGQASSSFTVAITSDVTAPAGGSVSYTNGYSTSSAINVTFTKGTDAGSGLQSASGLLQRSSATLSLGVCGTFGAFTTVATNPTSVYASAVTSGCQQYRYLISDNVGNQATYTSVSVVKVDQLAPTNTISLTNVTGAFTQFGGAVLYYKGNEPGSFKYTNALSDAESGPASVDYFDPAAAGWTHAAETVSTPAGGPYVSSTYSWTANPANPTLKSILGRDIAGKVWGAYVSFYNDTVAPQGVGMTYPNGVVNATSVPISLNYGFEDAGSGLDTTTTVVKRDVAPLTTLTETCGAWAGTYATTVTLVGGADTSVTSGQCYRYEYLVSDNVGNVTTFISPSVAQVDTTGPQVTAIASFQSGGVVAGNGKLETGDRLVLTFNQSLDAASVPATFSGATEADGGLGVDTLMVPGITDGPLDTGSQLYVASGSPTFGGTIALSNNGTATTVTLLVNSLSGAGGLESSVGLLAFKPATTIHDGGGNSATGTFNTSALFELF